MSGSIHKVRSFLFHNTRNESKDIIDLDLTNDGVQTFTAPDCSNPISSKGVSNELDIAGMNSEHQRYSWTTDRVHLVFPTTFVG